MRKFNVRWWRADDPDWSRRRHELMIREWNESARKVVEFRVSTVRQPPQVIGFYEPPDRFRSHLPPWLEMIYENIAISHVVIEPRAYEATLYNFSFDDGLAPTGMNI